MGEGSVITREPEESRYFWSLPLADDDNGDDTDDTPYILQTNYDHWNLDPTYFHCCNRTINGNACMDKIVSENRVSFAGVFQVLASKPNLAPGTIHTTLMSASAGKIESYMQYYNKSSGSIQVCAISCVFPF